MLGTNTDNKQNSVLNGGIMVSDDCTPMISSDSYILHSGFHNMLLIPNVHHWLH